MVGASASGNFASVAIQRTVNSNAQREAVTPAATSTATGAPVNRTAAWPDAARAAPVINEGSARERLAPGRPLASA